MYKAISDSLENRKMMNCIVLSIIILNYLICKIKFWMSYIYARNLQQIHGNCVEKHFAVHVQRFILCVKVMYNNFPVQYLLILNELPV